MFRTLIIAGALSLGLLTVDASPSLSGVNIDLNIGGGRISCRQGARVVANAGFRRVRPLSCGGWRYVYRGFRRDSIFEITVRARNGRITNVVRVGRRGGGYGGGFDGGYGDDYDDDSEY